MAILYDEAGNVLTDEAGATLYDEAGAPADVPEDDEQDHRELVRPRGGRARRRNRTLRHAASTAHVRITVTASTVAWSVEHDDDVVLLLLA